MESPLATQAAQRRPTGESARRPPPWCGAACGEGEAPTTPPPSAPTNELPPRCPHSFGLFYSRAHWAGLSLERVFLWAVIYWVEKGLISGPRPTCLGLFRQSFLRSVLPLCSLPFLLAPLRPSPWKELRPWSCGGGAAGRGASPPFHHPTPAAGSG
jgi:hypothetical protein